MSLLANVKFTYGQFQYFWGVIFVLNFQILIVLKFEELVQLFSNVKNRYQIPTNVKNRYQILSRVKNRYQILISVKISMKSSHVKIGIKTSQV